MNIRYLELGNCHFPIVERIFPEIPIILGRNQMPAKIKQIVNSSMITQEPLRLPDGFEPSHPSLPNPGQLV